MSKGLGVVPLIVVDGTDAAQAWYDALLDVRVELEYRLPGRAVLRFFDPGFELLEKGALGLGKKVAVRASDGTDSVPLMVGTVTGVRVECDQDGNVLEVVVHDGAHGLARGSTVSSYLRMSASDIVRQVAGRVGLTAETQASGRPLDYLLQVDSDLALLDALADRTGFDWWVEDGVLQFARPSTRGTLSVDLGDSLERFEVRASALRPDVVQFAGWDPAAKKTYRGEAPLTAERATALNGGASGPFAAAASPKTVLQRSRSALGADATARDQEEAQARAKSAAAHLTAGAVTATAVLHDAPEVRLGWDLVVGSAGALSGTYHVTRLEHRFLRSGYETVVTAGDRRPSALVDTLGSRSAQGPVSAAPSLVAAVVTLVGDPADREQAGRVKVKFQGLALDGAAGQESHWARVLTAGGGSDRGVLVMPEVDDEVLVGFERGDLRAPVVFGGLVSGGGGELYRLSGGKLGVRGLRSRLGHVVELADGTGPDDQHVLISLAGKKHRFRLGKDRCDLEVPSGVPLKVTVGGQSSLEFDGNGKVSLKGIDISIEATGKLELKGADVKVTGSAKVAVEAGGIGAFKASGPMSVEGGGPLTLKGALVAIN